jgi:hypothetical protein
MRPIHIVYRYRFEPIPTVCADRAMKRASVRFNLPAEKLRHENFHFAAFLRFLWPSKKFLEGDLSRAAVRSCRVKNSLGSQTSEKISQDCRPLQIHRGIQKGSCYSVMSGSTHLF